MKDITEYASPNRSETEVIKAQANMFKSDKFVTSFANSVPNLFLILNNNREIVYANKNFIKHLNLHDSESIIGKRSGEALKCLHSNDVNGCGTTKFCSKCGAVNAILKSQKNKKSTKECRIITTNSEPLDFRITATPYVYDDKLFTLFSLSDISDEKRRKILERVFFHDVLNVAGGISGLSEIVKDIKDQKEVSELLTIINNSSLILIDEIKSHQILTSAENNELKTINSTINSTPFITTIIELFSQHQVIENRQIKLSDSSENIEFISDKTILQRILINMIKNALEASQKDGIVTVSATSKNNLILFSVHNSTYMKKGVQLQIFKRSFSTKGEGRGIGTYSIRLFGEKYLNGKVSFSSKKESGTTFFLELPIKSITN